MVAPADAAAAIDAVTPRVTAVYGIVTVAVGVLDGSMSLVEPAPNGALAAAVNV